MTAPLDLYFALHLHQPVGNFGEVFEQHVREVYRPLIAALAKRPEWPAIIHISGPLLDWCAQHDHRLLDDLGRLALEGRLEFLLAGYYEPILATLPRADRLEQIAWLTDSLRSRFGTAGPGLWLTERVWEPDLARDLADAGVKYALIDDRPLLAAGHEPSALGAVFRTEHDGRHLDLLPIDERLRYLIPFKPVSEIVSALRARRDAGESLAVFADDAEKFGGWPGTHEWVFGSGWLDTFLDTLRDLQDAGEVRLVTGAEALRTSRRGGLTYLPTGSYREMEEWSLPAAATQRLTRLRTDMRAALGDARVDGPDGIFVRGSHWKHFLVKYPEANRLHKHMLAVSSLCRARGNPMEARRAIGMAQSNDPLWHGVFGGLYLPWLRESNWHHLARAEALLRYGQPLAIERRDIDADGHDELWVHGEHVSVVIAPHRGAAIETWLRLDHAENATDVLTRRVESYHVDAVAAHAVISAAAEAVSRASENSSGSSTDSLIENSTSTNSSTENDANTSAAAGAPSIHDLEHSHTLESLPPSDLDIRSLFQLRAIDASVTSDQYEQAEYVPLRSWTASAFAVAVRKIAADHIAVDFTGDDLSLTMTVHATGALTLAFDWTAAAMPAGSVMAIEISLGARTNVQVACSTTEHVHRYDIVSRAKSERGLETTVQGKALVYRIPSAAQKTVVELT